LRFVGGRQTELGGKFADFGFGETSFFERGADLKFGSGLSAGAIVSDVAGVFAIGDYSETFGFGERGELGEKFVFAEVTTIVWVREVLGVLEFGGANHADWKLKLLSEREGFVEFASREAGGIGDNGQRFVAENVASYPGEKDGIHAARVRHEARTIGT